MQIFVLNFWFQSSRYTNLKIKLNFNLNFSKKNLMCRIRIFGEFRNIFYRLITYFIPKQMANKVRFFHQKLFYNRNRLRASKSPKKITISYQLS